MNIASGSVRGGASGAPRYDSPAQFSSENNLTEQHWVEIFWPENSETSHYYRYDEDDEAIAETLVRHLPLPSLVSVLSPSRTDRLTVPVSVIF